MADDDNDLEGYTPPAPQEEFAPEEEVAPQAVDAGNTAAPEEEAAPRRRQQADDDWLTPAQAEAQQQAPAQDEQPDNRGFFDKVGDWLKAPAFPSEEEDAAPKPEQADDDWLTPAKAEAMQRSAPADDQSKPKQGDDDWLTPAQAANYKAPPPPPEEEEMGKAEAALHGFGHSVLPGAAAVATGQAFGRIGGAILGAPLGPVGSLIAGLGGGLAGGYLAGKAQSFVENRLWPAEAKRLEKAEHDQPFTTGAAEVAGFLPYMTPGLAGMGTRIAEKGLAKVATEELPARVLMGGAGASIDLAFNGDPTHAAGVGAASTLLGRPTALGSRVEAAGAQAGDKFSSLFAKKVVDAEAARTAPPPDPAVNARTQAKNELGASSVDDVGDQAVVGKSSNAPSESPGAVTDNRVPTTNEAPSKENLTPRPDGPGPKDYGKDATPTAKEGGVRVRQLGEINPAERAAVNGKTLEKENEGRATSPMPEKPAAPPREAAAARAPDERVQSDPIAAATKAAMPEGKPVERPPSTLTREGIVRGRSGRPIESAPLPIGSEKGILEKGYERAMGPKGEPREPAMEAARRGNIRNSPSRLNQPPLLESAPHSIVNTFRRIFAPEFMSPASEKAGEALRAGVGPLQTLHDKWSAQMEKHYPAVEKLYKNPDGTLKKDASGKLDTSDMDAFRDRLEGRNNFPNWKMPDELKPVAADIKQMREEYKEQIAKTAHDPEEVMDWNPQSLPHHYKAEPSPEGHGGGSGVRGSGGSLKARKYESYAQAKEQAGLEPAHANVLDSLKAYRVELGQRLGLDAAVKQMREEGHLKFASPEGRQGASGQQGTLRSSGRIHPDWKAVPELRVGDKVAYMPRDAANLFNNHLSPRLSTNPFLASLERGWRHILAAGTQIELGVLNGFHFFVVGTESSLSAQGRGVSQLSKGHIAEGLKSIVGSPAAGYTSYASGRRMQGLRTGVENRFTKGKPATEEDRAILKAAEDANVTPIGRMHAPDVNMSSAETLYKSVVRDSLGREMHEMAQKIKDHPLKEVPKAVWDTTMRTLQTTSEPLFGHYIPALKFGALIENARAAIKLGKWDIRTPQGMEKLTEFMRKESNAIDNRMGEMNLDNVFMHRAVSRAGYGALRSFSWLEGTVRAVGGGTTSALKSLSKSVSRDPTAGFKDLANKLDMTHKNYDPNVAYAIAFPFGIAFMGAVYQFLKTGELPKSVEDLYAPRTGGKVPGLGGRGTVDERVMLPGYHRDLFGWFGHEGPLHEAYAKLGSVPQRIIEQLTNRDWANRPIERPNATLAQRAADRSLHALKASSPIFFKGQLETPKQGTALGPFSRALGFKSAGLKYTDPKSLANFRDAKYQKEWDAKQRQEGRAAHGGTNPPPTPKKQQ